MSFDEQIFLILLKLNIPVFPLVAYAFDVIFKKPLPNPGSQRFTPLQRILKHLLLLLCL
jgi:hypothetical protein